MKIARTFIRGSALALSLSLTATGAFAGGNHNSAGSPPASAVCQTCQPHNDVRLDHHRRAEPDRRPAMMVPAVAQPHRMAPAPAVVQSHQQIPGIVILLGSF